MPLSQCQKLGQLTPDPARGSRGYVGSPAAVECPWSVVRAGVTLKLLLLCAQYVERVREQRLCLCTAKCRLSDVLIDHLFTFLKIQFD